MLLRIGYLQAVASAAFGVVFSVSLAIAAEDEPPLAPLQRAQLRWLYNHGDAPRLVSAERTIAAGIAAARAWAPCGVTIVYAGETTARPGTQDGINVVGWGRLRATGMGQDAAAVAIPWQRGGQTIEVDIVLDPHLVRTAHDLRFVLTHEFGHAIGLGHAAEADSVMHAGSNDQELDAHASRLDLRRCEKFYP